MHSFVFGKSGLGLPIPAHRIGDEGPEVLVLGGVHGDEIEGVTCAHGLLEALPAAQLRLRVTLVPAFNLDGVMRQQRVNSNGVDLNRNLPTKDWSAEVASERYHPGSGPNSEAENQALVAHLEAHPSVFVLSLHSWKPMLNVNGDCQAEAEAIAARTGYVIEPSVGYPTPGCLGTYCGLEGRGPTLTYEIERGLAPQAILETHVPAVIAGLKATQERS